MSETKVYVRKAYTITRQDLAVGDKNVVHATGTYETLEPLDVSGVDLGLVTAQSVADAIDEGTIEEGADYGGCDVWLSVTVTRPNPAYSGPDALFPDMTPPETITETVEL
jgi:hypothetical protein